MCVINWVNIGWPGSCFASIDLPQILNCSDKCMPSAWQLTIMKLWNLQQGMSVGKVELACMTFFSIVSVNNYCLFWRESLQNPGGKDELLYEYMNQPNCRKWMSLNFNISSSLRIGSVWASKFDLFMILITCFCKIMIISLLLFSYELSHSKSEDDEGDFVVLPVYQREKR